MTITNRVSLKSVEFGITPIDDVPDAPTIGTATAGVGSATVTFTPAATGGPVTTYTATSTPGSITGTSSSSPITVSGLTASTAYTFKVKGTNSTATGPESAASNSATPISVLYSSAIWDNQNTGLGNGVTTFQLEPLKHTVDSSGNTATVGFRAGNLGAYDGKGYVTYRNSSGTRVWTAYVSDVTYLSGAEFDSSGNLYVVGRIVSGGGVIVKYNSSGTLQWQRKFEVTGVTADLPTAFTAVTVDSSGNIYAVGNFAHNTTNQKTHGYIVKYDSSGSITWQRKIAPNAGWDTSTNSGVFPQGVLTDSSGNVYVSGYSKTQPQTNQNYTASFLIKYDSSGTMQFDRSVSIDASSSGQAALYEYKVFKLTKDSSDNFYLYGQYNKTQSNTTARKFAAILKFNSSGTYQNGYEFNYTGNTTTTTQIDSCNGVSTSALWFTGSFAASSANQSIVLFDHSAGTVTRTRGSDMGNAVVLADSSRSRVLLHTRKTISTSSFDPEGGYSGQDILGELMFSISDDGTRTGSYPYVTYNNTATTPTVASATASVGSNYHVLSSGSGTGTTPTYTSTLNPTTITSSVTSIS